MKRLVVLISDVGKGSNLQAILAAIDSKELHMELVATISDTKKAAGLTFAKKHKIPIKICANKKYLLPVLVRLKPDYIALAGWKQIILDEVIEAFPKRILNLHPGLIPDSPDLIVVAPDKSKALWNKGLLANKAIQNFLDKKSTYAGSSVHFLTHEFDFGPVLVRAFEKIIKGDTIETLYARLKKKEHQIYIKALKKLANLSKVLIIDGGGRGAALAQKYGESNYVSQVFAIPGNDFMKYTQRVITFPHLKTTDVAEIVKLVKEEKIDLIDVAQDDAVAAGLVDALQKSTAIVFGPTKKAGQIEWDKAWSRGFMREFKLPAPEFKVCKTEKEGINFIQHQPNSQWFVKASGLAAGKGAIFAKNNKEATSAINQMKNFGKAGKTYLIEECLEGEEFSAFAAVSGKKFEIIGYAQDHKRAFDGDQGPNTGGMGCSSPPNIITKKIEKQVKEIFKITIEGLASMNRSYTGILYLGGTVDKKGKIWIIEFNARWGDPEAQVILPSIKNDYYNFVLRTVNGSTTKIKKDNKYRIVITAASNGYPGDYTKITGKKINGFPALFTKTKTFGAGVKKSDDGWVASGGRLFYVLGEGDNIEEARKMAYNALSKISITDKGLHYRTDIGYRDLARYKKWSTQ